MRFKFEIKTLEFLLSFCAKKDEFNLAKQCLLLDFMAFFAVFCGKAATGCTFCIVVIFWELFHHHRKVTESRFKEEKIIKINDIFEI